MPRASQRSGHSVMSLTSKGLKPLTPSPEHNVSLRNFVACGWPEMGSDYDYDIS